MMITLCDLIHEFDLKFLRLNFENDYIWGITSGITSVHDKYFYYQFVILGGGRHSRCDVRNVGVSMLDTEF